MHWAIPGNYHVSVYHRNHLSVMTAYRYDIRPGLSSRFDLSDPQTGSYGTNSMGLRNGTALMYAGDADGNGQVQNTDNIMEWRPEVGTAGYKQSDFNLDGQVQNSDLMLLWRPNTGRGSAVPR
jgi:hypothetical protein